MSSKPWTNEQVEELVDAFRSIGPNFRQVGEKVGRDQRTTKAAWTKGLKPSHGRGFEGCPPIRDMLTESKVMARGELQRQAQAEAPTPAPSTHEQLAAMRADILEARVRTGQVIRASKANIQRAIPGLMSLVAATSDLAMRVAQTIQDADVVLGQADAQANEVSTARAMYMVKDVAKLQRDFLESMQMLNEMERLELGEPTEIMGHKITMSEEDARQFMLDAKEVFDSIDADAFEPEED